MKILKVSVNLVHNNVIFNYKLIKFREHFIMITDEESQDSYAKIG
jgi:hypothetical protein